MSLVGIEMKFPEWLLRLKQREDEIYLLVAATMQTNRGQMFDTSNAGRTLWAPLKLRDGQPLSQRGALRQSFGPSNDGRRPAKHPDGIVKFASGVVTIGTSVAYAPIHNLGGVIRPVKSKFLWIPLPDGKANSSNAPTDEAKKLRKSVGRRKKGDTGWKWTKNEEGTLIVRSPSGKVFLLAKKVEIPKRPMDEWISSDQEELEGVLQAKIAEVLNGAG